ncbi:MAG: polyprenyl synthetase family protein [Alphaproteobacteria bacterium]
MSATLSLARHIRKAPRDAAADVSHLASLLREDLSATEGVLQGELRSHVERIRAVASHLTERGGKRLRPLLTLASAHLSETPSEEMSRIHALAASVELLHSATLLHDDVVDGADLRRGKPSANWLWGNKSSVLTGDFLLARSFALMVSVESRTALEILSEAATVVANGEMLGLLAQGRTDLTREEIMEVLGCKTAKLFSAAMEAGCCLRSGAEERRRLSEFGFYVGLAFQLVDDVLDYEVSAELMGKSPGDDLRDRRMTLPVWLAFRSGSEEERDFWRRTIEQGDFRAGDLDTARGILRRHGALRQVREEASGYLRQAGSCLEPYASSGTSSGTSSAVYEALMSLLRLNASRVR